MCRFPINNIRGKWQRHYFHQPQCRVVSCNSRILRVGDETEEAHIENFWRAGCVVKTRLFSTQHTSPSRGVEFSAAKRGVGTIVATTAASTGNTICVTQLSKVSHKSPVRIIPTTTSAYKCFKQVSIGHYGGGMTEGDEAVIDIVVEKHSRLHVRTQGINRIYGHGNNLPYCIRGLEQDNEARPTKLSVNVVDAAIDKHGMLVYAPDPVSLHAGAKYQQCTNYVLEDAVHSNLVAIDWICSGRRYATESEHWHHTSCTTRTTLRFSEQSVPSLIDAQSITAEGMQAFAVSNHQFHAVATVILSGSMVVGSDNGDNDDTVVQRFLRLQSALASPYTAVRTSDCDLKNDNIMKTLLNEQLSKGGRVVVGVSKTTVTIGIDTTAVYAIRIAATSNEDIYRILHYSLLPIAPHLDGMECYKDRIVTSFKSSPTKLQPIATKGQATTTTISDSSMMTDNPLAQFDEDSNCSNYWTSHMLADSALPIGSFAHSSGIEVASQLGFLRSKAFIQIDRQSHRDNSVAAYVRAAVTSTMQLSTPLLWCSSHMTKKLLQRLRQFKNIDDGQEGRHIHDSFCAEYTKLDLYGQALLATNGPLCRASLDQGKNLWRVTQSAFLSSTESNMIDQENFDRIIAILDRAIESSEHGGHMTTVLGVVSRLLQINAYDAIRLYGYCVSRDVVNAAIRLNLIGPMEGQTILLQHARQASTNGISRAETAIASSLVGGPKLFYNSVNSAILDRVLSASISSATILDSIHPCHDILAIRLFRT